MKGRNMTRWRDPAKDPRQEPKSHLITAEGAERLRGILDHLSRVKRPALSAKVGEAAALGDRSENADGASRNALLGERHRWLLTPLKAAGTLCPHRLDQAPGAEDVDDAFHVVGKHVKAHFRADILEGFGQKVRRPHPGLQRPKRVLDCLASEAHQPWLDQLSAPPEGSVSGCR